MNFRNRLMNLLRVRQMSLNFNIDFSTMNFKDFRFKMMILFGAIFISTNALAQGSSYEYPNQQWIQFYEQAKINKHWAILADAGYRRKNLFAETSQYIARVALGYRINTHMRLAAGFANLGFYSSGPLSKLEFRPYEEWMIFNSHKAVKIKQRFRIEERFFKTITDHQIQSGTDFNLRVRYLLTLNLPVYTFASGLKLSVNAGNELLVNSGKNINNNISYQYRILVGPALKIAKNLTVKLTYNSQFSSGKTSGTYEHINIVWLGVKHKFSLSHAKK